MQEHCLLQQEYVVSGDGKSVEATLKAAEKEFGSKVSLTGFIRFQCGETDA